MLHLSRSVLSTLPPIQFPRRQPAALLRLTGGIMAIGLGACQALSPGPTPRNDSLPTVAPQPSPPAQPLHLLTWPGYAPPELVQKFEETTGFPVEVTYINSNAELIQRLSQQGQADSPAAYDLVTPLASDLPLTQDQYLPYQPLELERIDNLKGLVPNLSRQAVKWNNFQLGKARLSTSSPLSSRNRQNTGHSSTNTANNNPNSPEIPNGTQGQYGLPAAWGTVGLVVQQQSHPDLTAYRHLCDRSLSPGIALPDLFLSLMAAAYAQKLDPFKVLEQVPPDPEAWDKVLEASNEYLQDCQENIVAQGQDHQQMLDLLYDEAAIAALVWDNTGWLLQQLNPNFKFISPEEGALGWMTVFALPQSADNPDAAYAWIDFLYQPDQAAAFTLTSGFLSPIAATVDTLPAPQQDLIRPFYAPQTLDRIHWLPPHPLALESVTATYLQP
ncbi:MAG: ABC transporter substrate-binding protein [Prochlorothrix sp.]